MKKQILTLLATTILSLTLLSGCGNADKKANQVNIGYFNNITHAQALLMKAEGTLEQELGEDISVNWTAFNAGPAEVEALFSGAIDIGYIGPVPAISANVKSNQDIQILSSSTQAGAILVKRADSDINTVADLSGKTVAIPQLGNTQHLCLLHLLSENGLSATTEGGDVTVTALDNADVANAMERGDIDAALVPEPWGATLLAQGAQMVLDYDQIYENGSYDVAVVVVRKEFMEKNPEIVDTFLRVHEDATVIINEDRDASLSTINQELQNATGKSLSNDILTEAFSRITVSTELQKDAIEKFAEISKEQNFISTLPDEKLYVE